MTTTEQGILTLAQWLSPAFPVGAFAYSHGLEWAIQSGRIRTAEELESWLGDVLAFGSGRNDCILLRCAYAACSPEDVLEVNQTAVAISSSRQRVMETELQGDAFGQTAASIWGGDDTALCYPVAVGVAASHARLECDLTAAMYLHAFASNLVSVCVRAVPLGQTEGQRVLANDTRGTTLDDLSSTAFFSDIAAMQHETLQPRIFRS